MGVFDKFGSVLGSGGGVSTTVERRYVIVNLNNLTTAPSRQ